MAHSAVTGSSLHYLYRVLLVYVFVGLLRLVMLCNYIILINNNIEFMDTIPYSSVFIAVSGLLSYDSTVCHR